MGDLVEGFVEKRNKQLNKREILSAVEMTLDATFRHHYMLLKNEGYNSWWECPACKMKFETDISGMNCINVITEGTGPTGRGRTSHLEPACPKCFKNYAGR